jgi:hypothetical protein
MIDIPKDQDFDIPENLKLHNGILHARAMSEDPAIKCLNTISLARNLKITMKKAGLLNMVIFDEVVKIHATLGDFMDYQIKGANEAWNDYTHGKGGYAVEKADAVIGALLDLIYDERFVIQDKNSFTGRGEK